MILNIRRIDNDPQHQAERIDKDVLLDTFCFLACVKTGFLRFSTPFSADLAVLLSMIAAVGDASRARRTVLNEMRSIENVVRALLREAGIKLGTPTRVKFAATARERASDDAPVMSMVEPLLKVLAVMLDQFAALTKQVLAAARVDAVCRQL